MTGFSVRIPPALFNIGGPRSRMREESIRSSLLGKEDGVIRCPRIIRLGLAFGAEAPLEAMARLLREAHAGDPEELRELVELPSKPLICRPDSKSTPLAVAGAAPRAVLEQALMLGLCSATLYDPRRPVLWTTSSLTRRLELFDPEGFYA
ncbi:MAG: hypothetical protein HY553_14710 [Elusimicrobia bacterium]|nr:hypothetical protein [Elusimicrobiota bacterium]